MPRVRAPRAATRTMPRARAPRQATRRMPRKRLLKEKALSFLMRIMTTRTLSALRRIVMEIDSKKSTKRC